MTENLRVAMIGYGFMGAAHSQGWRVAPRFFDLPAQPAMTVVVGPQPRRASPPPLRSGAGQEAATDWREVIARDDIDVVDIVTPGDTHAEIAIAALEAGKHVLCEKPLANTVAEAEAMTDAAARAAERGVRSMVGFTYRRVPAATFARDLVAAGRIGEIRQVRASYLQDWLMDAEAPLTWRMQKDRAGSGALGDIGAHAVDLTEYITGLRLRDRLGRHRDDRRRAPAARARASGLSGTASTERGAVTVDDIALFTGRSAPPTAASAPGHRSRPRASAPDARTRCASRSRARSARSSFDLERLNELDFYDATLPATEQGFRKILVTEHDHPYLAPWWPAGHMLGYEHGFSHQVVDFVTAIAEGTQPRPSFEDGLHVQRVLDAVRAQLRARAAPGSPPTERQSTANDRRDTQ